MPRKRQLLAIQLGSSPEYPDLVYNIPSYRDGLLYICSHLLSTGQYEIDLCQNLWGDTPFHYDFNKYDAILISGLGHQVTSNKELLIQLNKAVGNKPVIMGGNHATFAPYDALHYADFAVIGPGEYPVEILLNRIFDGPYPTPDDIPDRIAMKSPGGELIIGRLTKQSPPMIPIHPSLFKNSPRLVWATVNFTRGCPYNCKFCYAVRVHGQKFIKKDIDVIEAELTGIHKATGCSFFYISDLNFGLDKNYTRAIIEKIRGKNYNFVAMSRMELGDDVQLVDDLKNVGFSDFFLGIESLDSGILSSYNKKLEADLQAKRVRTFTEKGLAVHGVFIFGVEGQAYDDILYAAEWSAENEISYCFFVCYMEYPYQNRLYGTEQRFPDWRIIQSSPAYQNYCYVGIFPTNMRPSKLQRTFIKGYKKFMEMRLASKEKSYRMTKIKIWNHNLRYVLEQMETYAQYLESIEAPFYNRNDELKQEHLRDYYYEGLKHDPTHFENVPLIIKK